MPIPLNYNKNNQNNHVDYSFLLGLDTSNLSLGKENTNKIVTASDKDAELLMKMWKSALNIREKTYKITGDVSSQDFSRLKSSGFIMGDTNACQLTPRGQKIIKVMALGESNAFLKNQKSKSYTEIMASTNKRGKKGFRIASQETEEQIGEEMENFKLTQEEWTRIGNEAGWLEKTAGNGMIPGQAPYTPEEKKQFDDLMSGALEDEEEFGINESNEDDFISRHRTVKVYLDDGDVITTGINGTKKEIENYYYKNKFVAEDETTMRGVTDVVFIE